MGWFNHQVDIHLLLECRQAIQTVYVLPEPSAAADKKFASMTTRFVYSPIRG